MNYTENTDKPILLGNVTGNKTSWYGKPRTQDQVYDSNGVSPCLTALHSRHEFKIAEYIKCPKK